MATRRDFEASKERPRFDGLGAARSLLYMRLLLADLVMPAEIAGERIRYRIDGSKIKKVFLDPKEHNSRELETFSAVYRMLSGKDVVFEYPVTEA
ncbi:small ribosomal subunit protein eS7-like [Populus alba]|uniref:small ribosomal subunit protein eS7-like n=1 Tax=Populus alba TaxID=43335 RepID=UPI00158DEEF0|nr:40S ribosomal protein S7-like [Populus alba]